MKNTSEVWVSRHQGAWLAKLSVERFDAVIRPAILKSRKNGRNVELDGQAVVDAICSHRAETGAADPLLNGGDSPNLERYRAARASMAEMELDRARGSHVRVEDIGTMLIAFSTSIRRGGDVLRRKFGNEAAEILAEAIDDAERAIKALNGNSTTNHS